MKNIPIYSHLVGNTELSDKCAPGHARIWNVAHLKNDYTLCSIFSYPTLEIAKKSIANMINVTGISKDKFMILQGSVFYAGNSDYNSLVKY